jgi:hypothetical protein
MMSVTLEKIFFSYILKNKKFYDVVKPFFFRNAEIQFVYNILRDYMLLDSDTNIPSPKQILEMVSLEDRENIITKEILKSILQVDLKEYDEKKFVEPKFNAWVLSNRLKTGTVDIIEETRGLDSINDFDKAIEAADRIRTIVNEMASTNFVDDDDLGTDFDDAEAHNQNTSSLKVKSGFETIDHMLGGGWDQASLNLIMAQTNGGKCSSDKTILTIRNKHTNEISNIEIGELFTKIRSKV